MANDGGLSRFRQRMQAIPKAAREAVVPALVKGADEIADTQRRLAPVDDGDLRDSIEVTRPGEGTPAYSQPGGARVAGELEAIVTAGNSHVRYAHLVEHGTTKATAQAFFWPGFRLERKRALTRIRRSITKSIKGTKK